MLHRSLPDDDCVVGSNPTQGSSLKLIAAQAESEVRHEADILVNKK